MLQGRALGKWIPAARCLLCRHTTGHKYVPLEHPQGGLVGGVIICLRPGCRCVDTYAMKDEAEPPPLPPKDLMDTIWRLYRDEIRLEGEEESA